MIRPLLYVLLGFLLTGNVFSQDRSVDHQQVAWVKYSMTTDLSSRWGLNNYFEERFFIGPIRDHMFLGDISTFYRTKNRLTFSGGVTFVRFTLPHDPTVEDISIKLEVRPYQTVGMTFLSNNKWKISGRTKLEQRFFKTTFQNEGFAYASMRLRNRINIYYHLTGNASILLFNDHIIHHGKEVPALFDQNRANISLLYKLSSDLKLELGYLNWYQRRRGEDVYVNRHSWKLSLFHNL